MMHGLSSCLKILADETRIRVLHLLEQEPLTVAELQELLKLRQSSVSSHLAKLKAAQLICARAEGASHRYRLREDAPPEVTACWQVVRGMSQDDPDVRADREQLVHLRSSRGASWVECVAGSLHRSYAPGRTWETLGHGLLPFVQLGCCVDVGAGDGAMMDVLAPAAQELICVDPSAAMCQAAEKHRAERGFDQVRILQTTGEDLPLADGSADSVLFLQSLQYVQHPDRALKEALRLLAPGGRLLILTLVAHDYLEAERYGHLHRGFTDEQLQTWCAGLQAQHCYHLPPEDQSPRFQSLVFTAVR
jgi:DNA-binding transcriptional ArsR family regulator/precorrin-6B methylase 2